MTMIVTDDVVDTLDETTTTTTMTTRATTPALQTRATIAIVTTAKTPAHRGDGDGTGSASSLAAGGRVIHISFYYLLLIIGAVLIKNYTSLPTNPIKVPRDFFANK
jgi:hypothetical protein